MQIEVKKLEGGEVEITCEMLWDEFLPFFDSALATLSCGLSLPGFRPGKVPNNIAAKEIGGEHILARAADLAVKKQYGLMIEKEKLEPIGFPRADILKLAKNNSFSFRVRTNVLPKIALPNIKQIVQSIKKQTAKATESEVAETLDFLVRSRAVFEELQREAQQGDFVEVEYQSPALENNKPFKDSFILGKGHFVPGFENHFLGMKQDEEKEFEVFFPKEYHKKGLADKKIGFKVKMEKVKLMKLPTLNDEFAKTLGNFDTLENLKKSIEQGVSQEKELAEKQKWREAVIEKIAQETNFEVPKALITIEQERILKETKKDFEKMSPEEKQSKKEEIRPKIKQKIKEFLCLLQLGRENKVVVSEADIKQQVNRHLTTYPQLKPNSVEKEQLKDYYKGILYNKKVFQVLENYDINTNNH